MIELVFIAAMVDGASVQRSAPLPQPSVREASGSELARPRSVPFATQRTDKGRRVRPLADGESPPVDRFRVEFPLEAATLLDPSARSGRVVLFLKARDSQGVGDPADGPFFNDLQPVASTGVDSLAPGMTVEFGPDAIWWPEGAARLLEGEYEVQAVFDSDVTGPGHLAAGNLFSAPIVVDFNRASGDEVTVILSQKIEPLTPSDGRSITDVSTESALLSAAAGKRVHHEASVVFPRDYGNLNARRRHWPTIYEIAAPGRRAARAREIAGSLTDGVLGGLTPQAVYVILDGESPLGPHSFVDSAANGPRGTALVAELIPYLEDRFRLVREAGARVVAGHGSGGWAAIWLALEHPRVFSAAFASAPDPVDFSAFATSNLYKDENLFVGADGSMRPAFRQVIGPTHDLVPMLVADEVGVDHAISPSGKSAGRFDAWAASYSPIDPATNAPRRLCDPMTGAIDPVAVEAWSAYDIVRRIRRDPATLGLAFATRIHILMGARDSFYYDLAALSLRDTLDACAREVASVGESLPDGPGYVEIVSGATHDSILPLARLRFAREIREHFRAGRFHE